MYRKRVMGDISFQRKDEEEGGREMAIEIEGRCVG